MVLLLDITTTIAMLFIVTAGLMMIFGIMKIVNFAHGALLTTFPGDTTMSTLDQVRAFAKGGSARIQR